MFTFDDMLEKVGANQALHHGHEFFATEIGSVQPMELADMQKLFPDEKFSETKSVIYLPVKMCHSLPKVNKRGRAFTPNVLANSVASVRDNLVNLDHMLADNCIGEDDVVLGHMKTARFAWTPSSKEVADANSVIIPDEPIPMHSLAVLYLRHKKVPGILKDHNSGRHWLTSMECGHSWDDACFWYEKEFIPIKDADQSMLECIEKNRVKDYKGKPLAVCLGGLNKSVDFWGLGLTQTPADDGSDIMGIIAAGREVASWEDGKDTGKKQRYFPIRFERFSLSEKTLECANVAVDKRLNELASIKVIGNTDPHEDGHAHEVLSDGTVLPAQGHPHRMENFSLTTGTRPRLTGRTDLMHDYVPSMPGYPGGERKYVAHSHMINIDLRGSKKSSEVSSLDVDLETFLEDDTMTVAELMQKFEALEAKVSTGKSEDGKSELLRELASMRGELANLSKSEEITKAVTAEIDARIKAGRLLVKEKADEAVAEAVKKVEETHKAELDKVSKTQSRFDEIMKLGIQLEATPYDDQPELTIKDRINAIGMDDVGEREFKTECRFLKVLADREKEKLDAEEKARIEKAQGQGASAANIGKPAPKKRVPLLAGQEIADDPAGGTATTPAKPVGKSRLLAAAGRS